MEAVHAIKEKRRGVSCKKGGSTNCGRNCKGKMRLVNMPPRGGKNRRSVSLEPPARGGGPDSRKGTSRRGRASRKEKKGKDSPETERKGVQRTIRERKRFYAAPEKGKGGGVKMRRPFKRLPGEKRSEKGKGHVIKGTSSICLRRKGVKIGTLPDV